MRGQAVQAVFDALGELGEYPLVTESGADDISLMVGIREEGFERAIRKIYEKILCLEAI